MMKQLDNPNIVKYIDAISDDSHLYIVIEYMENGSLSGVCKKFGNMDESLVAIWMQQVLSN